MWVGKAQAQGEVGLAEPFNEDRSTPLDPNPSTLYGLCHKAPIQQHKLSQEVAAVKLFKNWKLGNPEERDKGERKLVLTKIKKNI